MSHLGQNRCRRILVGRRGRFAESWGCHLSTFSSPATNGPLPLSFSAARRRGLPGKGRSESMDTGRWHTRFCIPNQEDVSGICPSQNWVRQSRHQTWTFFVYCHHFQYQHQADDRNNKSRQLANMPRHLPVELRPSTSVQQHWCNQRHSILDRCPSQGGRRR